MRTDFLNHYSTSSTLHPSPFIMQFYRRSKSLAQAEHLSAALLVPFERSKDGKDQYTPKEKEAALENAVESDKKNRNIINKAI